MMRTFFGPAVGWAMSAFLLMFGNVPNAGAVVIYDYSAICISGCTGQTSGVLTLADTYVPGSVLNNADFVSFTYISSAIIDDDVRFPDDVYNLPGDDTFFGFIGANPTLPAVSGPALFTIFSNGTTGGGDSFIVVADRIDASIDLNQIAVSSSDPIFTLRAEIDPPTGVPEPGTLGMLALPLLAFGILRRRRDRG